jgi:EmrB/QacA subfamily drug resistance transporter
MPQQPIDAHAGAPTRSPLASLSAMLGICLVIMLIALDQTVVGTALPRIVAELQGYALYPWTASAYLMTSAVMIPITGRLGDLFGRKSFVLAAILMFSLASALCGAADSMLQLVLARGLQGVGGGMLVGVAFASVSDLFPDRLQRVRWQAMLSATFGISTALGPALGGWLTEHHGWRSVFYVNLPVALLGFAVVWRFLPRIVHAQDGDRRIDWLGALLLALSISMLLFASEQGQAGGFASLRFAGLLAGALIAGFCFLYHQRHSSAPIIPSRLFANRAVQKLSALGALTGLTMFVLVFYSPLMLQGGFGMTPKEAGMTITPLLVFVTVGSIINGRLLPRLPRPERLIAYGQAALLVGSVLLAFLGAGTTPWKTMLIFALCGLSLGFQLPNLTLQIQAAVGRHDLGIASALIQTARMIGSMIGASLAGLIVNRGFELQVGKALASAHIHDVQTEALLATPQVLVRAADQATLARLALEQGFDLARLLAQARLGLISGIHYAFLGCAVVVLFSLFISLRLPRYVLHGAQRPD